MGASVEFGKCDCCGDTKALSRKYYYYDISCDCCSGNTHFEIVRYCNDCKPVPPIRINVLLTGVSVQEEDKSKRITFNQYWGNKGEKWNGKLDIKDYSKKLWHIAVNKGVQNEKVYVM